METVITIISAFLGSMGFALIYGVRNKLLFPASVGGLISCAMYLIFDFIFTERFMFLNCFLATVIVAIYVHIMAYALKAATLVFLMPAIIPLVPGRDLYYAFFCLYRNEQANMYLHIGNSCKSVFSVAAGMTVIWAAKIAIRNAAKLKKSEN